MLIIDGRRFAGIASKIAAILAGPMGSVPSLHGRHSYRRTTGKALRNPKDPVQQARIQAAADKRVRKDQIRVRNFYMSRLYNVAHRLAGNTVSLDPFFIAR